jgi:hypothetical protein
VYIPLLLLDRRGVGGRGVGVGIGQRSIQIFTVLRIHFELLKGEVIVVSCSDTHICLRNDVVLPDVTALAFIVGIDEVVTKVDVRAT